MAEMVDMLNQGATYKEIAEMTGRTEHGVAEKLRTMGYGIYNKATESKKEDGPEVVVTDEGKTLTKVRTLDDYPARELIKNLFDRGYRIENNKLYYIHKKEVNLKDVCR